MNGQGESRGEVTVAGRAEGKVKVTELRMKARPVPARPVSRAKAEGAARFMQQKTATRESPCW